MLLSKLKYFTIIFAVILISSAGLFAQSKCSCCKDKDANIVDAFTKQDSTHMHKKHDDRMGSSNEEMKNSIVHEGEIDLAAIDANEDGMVFQDQMCWNVISDEKGECPLCGMTLKEVSLEKAKENLVKYGFEVK